MNNELLGVIIDPAHGGKDLGTVKNGINEKDVVLEISNYIRKRLDNLGIDTIMTRSDDITLSPNERINRIKSTLGDRDGIVVISNRLNNPDDNTTKIIYSVNENDFNLINNIKNQLEFEGLSPIITTTETLPSDKTKDANILQRELENAHVITIDYGNIITNNDFEQITDDLFNYAEGVVRGIALNYGIAYEEPTNIKNKTHVVTKGESLYSIANQFDTTIGAIKALNNLKSNILSIGQILKLPNYVNLTEEADDILIYTVEKGDTLYSIAKKYGLDSNELIEFNQLFNTILTIGQQIIIPIYDKQINNNNNNSNDSIDNTITYIVNSGDTLYSIAKKYGINVNELMEINNLNSTMISLGQQLSIPKTENFITYFVRTDDTLNSIANKFNTTIDEQLSADERNKAITETVKRLKRNSLDIQSRSASDLTKLQEIFRSQKELDNLHLDLD